MTAHLPNFTPLPVESGIGRWDLNRFRTAFRSERSVAELGSVFTSRFPRFLDSPAATVQQFGDKLKFNGRIELQVDASYPQPHPDWVQQVAVQPTRGFTVQTLHRDTPDSDDLVFAAGGVLAGLVCQQLHLPFGPVATGVLAVWANRYHFLAGRRAWRLDNAAAFDTQWNRPFPKDAFILETAAVERISILPYLPMRVAMPWMVPNVWCNLLDNFVQQMGCKVLPLQEWPLENGWKFNFSFPGKPHYYMASFGLEGDMTAKAEYHDTLRLHTFLRS